MPVTRSRAGSAMDPSEQRPTVQAIEPRGEAPTRAPPREESTTTATTATSDETGSATTDFTENTKRSDRTKRAKSKRSEAAKLKLAEAETKEEIAALELREIRASLALAKAKLERQRVAAAAEEDTLSTSEEEEDQSVRVQEWLTEQPKEPPGVEEELKLEEDTMKGRGQGARAENESGHRDDVPRPARQPQNVDITSLAAAITQAVRVREAPRYIQELPTFNGHVNSWLAFRAAYHETSELFSKNENVARLRRSLKGTALEAVSSMLICQPDPIAVIEALERRFGRPDVLALAEIAKIKALERIRESPRELCIFAGKVANVVATLEALKKIQYIYNPELVKTTIEKLTPILRSKWYDYAAIRKNEDVPELKRLAAFLNDEADKCGPYAQAEETNTTTVERTARRRHEVTFTADMKREPCHLCKQNHHLPDCRKFLEMEISGRWEIAKKFRKCFQCLRSSHRRGNCRAKKCGHEGCNMAHHRLLHSRKATSISPPPSSPLPQEIPSSIEIVKNMDCTGNRQAFLKIAPVTLTGPNGTTINTYALMDDGSTVTLIEERLAEILGLRGPRNRMWIQGLNETVKHDKSRRVAVKVRGRNSDEDYVLKGVRTVPSLSFTKQKIDREDTRDCLHLKDIEEQLTYSDACPKLLIGQDNWELLVAIKMKTGRRDQPVASLTRLGWVLHGYKTSSSKPVAFCGHTMIVEDNSMEKMMKDFYDLETLGIEARKPKNDPEERAVKILKEKSRRLPDGRFETGLLWKHDHVDIPNNYADAYKRLKTLEKKLDRDPGLKEKYKERIDNLFASGYATPAVMPPKAGSTWYLPHFAVCNPAKPKIRLVHDAAARSHGRSLNDMLLSGPDLLQSLPGVIMRFRQHPVAVTSDIQEMFMQIRIRREDRDALRFLWRGDDRGETKPREYQMTSVIFGATSSPSTALYIKNRNAEEYQSEFPEAAKEITRNHYMDDFISSFPNENEAIRISKEVDYVHRQAGFKLRGWASNRENVLNDLGATTETAIVPIGGDSIEKTLGLLWDVQEDSIGFQLNEKRAPPEVMNNSRPPTKREALSIIMSIYDPLGLISPLTTPAKRLMQDTWRYGTSWDQPIPEELQDCWNAWSSHIQRIRNLRIPRCYHLGPRIEDVELHTFVDASEEAYATAIYMRMLRTDGSAHITLVAGKSRVAPLKPTSIPRLELQAALLGARLARTVEEEHDTQFKRKIYWSDSRTVLSWIRAEPRTFKTFVAHRLAEIEDLTKVNEWKWVPTKENVADDATRATPADFDAQHRWFHGPAFLKQPEECWPIEEKITKEKTGEERCLVVIEEKSFQYMPNIDHISKWNILIRATARVLQFIDLCKKRKCVVATARRKRTKENATRDPSWNNKKKFMKNNTRKNKETQEKTYLDLQADYLIRAEKLWLLKMQDDSYSSERKRILLDAAPSPKDKLATLSVQLGGDGLLRLRGRISAAAGITEETASPALMDGQHKYTKMYIQHLHEEMLHSGVETTVNELRQRFWVTRIRPTVKGIIRSCPQCQIRRAKPTRPATGNLPTARLSHHTRPFSFTGLDYFGPLEVTVGRHHEKRWVALFTCLTIRAIHLEVVPSLNADSAISALRRFIARRGQPTELWTDNATCFKAADKELKAAWAALEDESNSRRIKWRYIPPASPFMGGAWERMVRSVKETLRVILREKHPSDETLHTLLLEAENIVNSRPLTHVAVAPEEDEALTPNHILLGPNSHVPAPGSFSEEDQAARQQWRRAQRLADDFWRRWVKEYLPLLQHRREPRTTGRPPKVGDLVIIGDPNLPRNVWPRGRVTSVYPGEDGEVRVVDVTTSNGHTLRRPCKRIIVLPVESQTATAGEMCTTEKVKKKDA